MYLNEKKQKELELNAKKKLSHLQEKQLLLETCKNDLKDEACKQAPISCKDEEINTIPPLEKCLKEDNHNSKNQVEQIVPSSNVNTAVMEAAETKQAAVQEEEEVKNKSNEEETMELECEPNIESSTIGNIKEISSNQEMKIPPLSQVPVNETKVEPKPENLPSEHIGGKKPKNGIEIENDDDVEVIVLNDLQPSSLPPSKNNGTQVF